MSLPHVCGDDAEHPLQEAEVDLVGGDDAGQASVAVQQPLVDTPPQRRRGLLLRGHQRWHQIRDAHQLRGET